MNRLDLVRHALQELGSDATSAQIGKFVVERYGQVLGIQFIPVYRATLRGEEQLRLAREMAAIILAEDRAGPKHLGGRMARSTPE